VETLEKRLSTVERALARIEERLALLERASAPQPVEATVPIPAWREAPRAPQTDLTGVLTLIGRTFVVFAGAYLLRALAETGSIDRTTATVLGFGYAAAWTLLAYRIAPRRPLSATFFGASTVLIGVPLIWEATTRFALLAPEAGALALASTTALVLVVAWRRDLHALAWVATIAACVAGSLLLVVTGGALAFAAFFIALGVATLWLGYDRDWTMLRWIPALFADLAVVGLAARALATPPRDQPWQVMLLQLTLLVGYLGSIVIRTIVRRRDVVPFEAVQTAAMLLSGLAGAVLIAYRTGAGAVTLGPALLVLAAACYAVVFVDPRQGRGPNLYFYTSLGLVFALTGLVHLLEGPSLGVGWAAMAVAVGWAGHRDGRRTFALHSVVYLAAAAVSSRLMASALAGLFASADARWEPIGAAAWLVALAVAVCWVQSRPMPVSGTVAGVGDGLRLTLAVFAFLSAAGIGVVVVRSMLPASEAALHGPLIATVRTGVIAAAAVALAWLGGSPATREFGLMLYPVLGWGALKLVFEDLRTSPPSLLVVAFALYGGALILGPRIAKARARAVAARTSPEQPQTTYARF
jgi:hypothetical protein